MDKLILKTIQNIFSENNIPYDISRIKNDYIYLGKVFTVIFKDILIHNICKDANNMNKQCITVRDDIERIIPKLKEKGIFVFDSWAVKIEAEKCDDCPAYQWVIHRIGIHPCCLFEEIKEDINDNGNWVAAPVRECIRPKTIGASYLIAKEKGLSEPMVGKGDLVKMGTILSRK